MTEGIIYILINDTAIKAAVGKNKEDNKHKVYPVYCPTPEQHPFIVVKITGKTPIECMDSRATDFDYSFAVFAYAKTYQKVDELDIAIEDALDRYTGTAAGVDFQEIRFVTTRDEGVNLEPGGNLYCRVISFEAHVTKTYT